MDLEHPAAGAEDAASPRTAPVVEPEVEDHERLRRRDALVDHRRQLGDRIVHLPLIASETRSRSRCRLRGRPPFAQPGQERALRRRRRARARVVEREERRRPAERGRDRVLEEPVRLGVRRDARMRVDVDRPGSTSRPVASITDPRRDAAGRSTAIAAGDASPPVEPGGDDRPPG